MKDNTMVYFILGLMCILIGGHYSLNAHHGSGVVAGMLVALGVVILFALGVQIVRSMMTYANNEEKEIEKKE